MGVFEYDGEITIDGRSIPRKHYETTAISKEQAKTQIAWQVRVEYEITHQLWKKVDLLDWPHLKPIITKNVIAPGDEKINNGEQISFDIPYSHNSRR